MLQFNFVNRESDTDPLLPQLTEIQNTYILLRHGETDFNAKRLFPGSLDVPLNNTGITQAREVKLPLTPQRVLASPLGRALHTARLVLGAHQLDVSIHIDSRLQEKHGGVAEGLSLQELQTAYPEVWSAWDLEELPIIASRTKYPHGESDLDVAIRLQSLIHEIESKVHNEVFLLVTHGGVMRAMRLLAGLSKKDIYPGRHLPNCAIEIYRPGEQEGIIYE